MIPRNFHARRRALGPDSSLSPRRSERTDLRAPHVAHPVDALKAPLARAPLLARVAEPWRLHAHGLVAVARRAVAAEQVARLAEHGRRRAAAIRAAHLLGSTRVAHVEVARVTLALPGAGVLALARAPSVRIVAAEVPSAVAPRPEALARRTLGPVAVVRQARPATSPAFVSVDSHSISEIPGESQPHDHRASQYFATKRSTSFSSRTQASAKRENGSTKKARMLPFYAHRRARWL